MCLKENYSDSQSNEYSRHYSAESENLRRQNTNSKLGEEQKKIITSVDIGAGSGVPGGAQAPPELFLAPPEPFEPPLTIKTIMH